MNISILPKEARKKQEERVIFLDVRTKEERTMASLEPSLWIPVDELEQRYVELYTKKELSYNEQNKIGINDALSWDYKDVSEIIKLSDEVKDITGIFDNKKNTIFIDWGHISEEGNSIIAEEISDDIINYLRY